MTIKFNLTPGQVHKAVAAALRDNPIYGEMLGFYGRLFVAQEESKCRLRIEPLHIPDEVLTLKRREKFPLIEIKEFGYDRNESTDLFHTIGEFAKEANPKLAAAATVILNAIGANLSPELLFNALLNGNEAVYENIAQELDIEKQILGLFAYNSLKPSLCTVAEQVAVYLKKDGPWLKGYCPICGSSPNFSILDGEGSRSLICSFCWYQWAVKRVYCPFCNTSEGKELQYLFSEEEKELRVDLCAHCRKYLKTIDMRETDRLIYLPLEQLTTLHLDIKAREDGFESGARLYMEG